jgi:hypothetical protein
MRAINEFALSVTIEAPLEEVWREMVDWEGQSEWMLATRVYDDATSPDGVGHTLRAFTGPVARWNRTIGVMDEMVVSKWDPPHFCRVEHVGRIIRGYGTFTLTRRQIYDGGIRDLTHFDWYEEINAPRWILLLVKPGVLLGVWISLQRFKRRIESDIGCDDKK